ncbi:MAG: hypothetical protein ACOX75_05370 [Lachnospiraceae bacterium]|jgi:hypothetical protein
MNENELFDENTAIPENCSDEAESALIAVTTAADEITEGCEREDSEGDAPQIEVVKSAGWTKVTTFVVVLTAAILLGFMGWLAHHEGLFDSIRPKVKSVCTIEDFDTIEVLRSQVNVPEEEIDTYIKTRLNETGADELTDEWCSKNGATYFDEGADTVEGFHACVENHIYTYYLHNAMFDYIRMLTTVKSYDEEKTEELKAYAIENLEHFASYYGTSAENLATMQGYESIDAYATEEAHFYLESIMILDEFMKKLNLSYTKEDVDADLAVYMRQNGLSKTYTLEEFKETNGELWLYLYENLQYKFDLVMTALDDNVTIIEDNQE